MSLLLLALGMSVVVAGLLIFRFHRKSLPQTSGVRSVAGLRQPVDVLRDRYGVPHIYASCEDDLFFAQGYVHAQDRLWQMELHRRIGFGRLAEIFGKAGYELDCWLRTLGFEEAARRDLELLDDEARRSLAAYYRGVNAFVESHRRRLPIEFRLLRFQPEPFSPMDAVVWGKVMSWGLCGNWDSELVRAALIAKVGPERAAELHWEYPPENPLILPGQSWIGWLERIRSELASAAGRLPLPGVAATSNNWVVDGALSASGKPLLASDPHLGLTLPAIWYENHLCCPEAEAAGVSIPGIPSILIGHNARIAWGVTAALVDVQDLYLERFHPEDPTLYEYCGQWEKVRVRREWIKVRGEAQPRPLDVAVTRHGPLITQLVPDALKPDGRHGLAVRWIGQEPGHSANALRPLNRAANWDEFNHALDLWDAPAQNFVYADVDGHIGYRLAGKVPIRAQGIGLVPVPGWTGECEWTGFVAAAEMPRAFDPSEHFLATANNAVAGKEYPHFLTTEALNGYRARRIREALQARGGWRVKDFQELQTDLFSRPALEFAEFIASVAVELKGHALLSTSPAARAAVDLLAGWDGVLAAQSRAAAVYQTVLHFAMRGLFTPWLGELTEHYLGVGFHTGFSAVVLGFMDHTPLVALRMLRNDEKHWFRDAGGKPLGRIDILAKAFCEAAAYLARRLGPDPGKWEWGRIHQCLFGHPLGAKRILARLFNRGPFPQGGDSNTIAQASFVPRLPIPPTGGFSASWRQVIDLSDWDRSVCVLAGGQSGQPASKNYADQIKLWRSGECRPMWWSREKVEAAAVRRLRLVPEASSTSRSA